MEIVRNYWLILLLLAVIIALAFSYHKLLSGLWERPVAKVEVTL